MTTTDATRTAEVPRQRSYINRYTYFGRFLKFARSIDLKGLIDKDELDLMIVGPGDIPYEVYEVIAYLEGNDKTINNLSILDIDQSMLGCVRATHSFHVDKYDPRSSVETVLANPDWIEYANYTSDVNESTSDSGLANIPSSLERRLESGNIQLSVADITYPDFDLDGVFDFVVCRQVIYQCTFAGAEIVAANLSCCMKPGALLLIGEGYHDNMARYYPEFTFRGLGPRELERFGLRYHDSQDIPKAYRPMILVKE